MVDTTGDIPGRDDVTPDRQSRHLIADVLESGEVIVHLDDGSSLELHKHDTYDFGDVMYTKQGDSDIWFYTDKVTSIERHYD